MFPRAVSTVSEQGVYISLVWGTMVKKRTVIYSKISGKGTTPVILLVQQLDSFSFISLFESLWVILMYECSCFGCGDDGFLGDRSHLWHTVQKLHNSKNQLIETKQWVSIDENQTGKTNKAKEMSKVFLCRDISHRRYNSENYDSILVWSLEWEKGKGEKSIVLLSSTKALFQPTSHN